MLITLAVAASAVIALNQAAPAQDFPDQDRTRVSVETYVVEGSTLPELTAAVIRQAESASTLDDGAASTTISFEPNLTYEKDGLVCRLGSAAVDLAAIIRLPEWTTPELGDDEARRAWAWFSAYLRWHEGRAMADFG
ncbi:MULTISPECIES: DUF922 domain-containing protein [unclassified Aurantimonas]|uniref:DUF922 domain-containing protein n=1 Tax=unclassified Aurantimonas TaxID=2638230 RepID=UPI002E18A2B6|nr:MULTISPECIES: DUF922 domain-containing protein [unclassified Aurantimonas]MEC5293828.1 DUF922 domain-containing protein [Aurantimonas sp. C2-3-R2]MEC5414861.1 DUF922 domain-containing protein [Aurantimonas sp. C2-4-R8]